jgi:hypothetical protein
MFDVDGIHVTRSLMTTNKFPGQRGSPRHDPIRSALMNFHDITMTSITGDQVSFADYEGKMALVVNVASA